MTLLRRLVSSLAILALPVLAHADGVQLLRDFVARNPALAGEFSQRVQPLSGDKISESSGMFSFTRPGKFRWEYQKPYAQLLLTDGNKFWLYDEDLQQVTVRTVADALRGTPAAILAGGSDLDKYFKLANGDIINGVQWVNITPLDTQSSFTDIGIGFRNGQLASMRLLDQFGNHTVLSFSKLQFNPKLASGQFSFTVPKGVDVIKDAP